MLISLDEVNKEYGLVWTSLLEMLQVLGEFLYIYIFVYLDLCRLDVGLYCPRMWQEM